MTHLKMLWYRITLVRFKKLVEHNTVIWHAGHAEGYHEGLGDGQEIGAFYGYRAGHEQASSEQRADA